MPKLRKVYLVIGDNVTSKTDGDRHYVNAHTLMRLYGLSMQECYLAESHDKVAIEQYQRHELDLIILQPRYDGNYNLKEVT